MGRIDDNNEYVMMGEDPSGNPIPLKVDTVTGELLVNVEYGAGTPDTPAKQGTVDDNSGYVTMAEDPDGNPVPFTVRTSDNRLYISSGGDTDAPSLSSWSIDLEADTMTMIFDESVDASTLDVTVITLQDAATAANSYTLTDSTTASADGTTIVVDLSATDLAAIRADADICTSTSNAYITFTSAMIDDLAGNNVNAIADGSGQQATAVTYTFAPTDFSSLFLWLDASDASTIDDSTATPDVDSWTDKSSNGFVFSQSSASAKPHTGGDINGLNAITFDGSNDRLVNTSGTDHFDGQSGKFFVVLNRSSGSGFRTFFCKGASNVTSRFCRLSVYTSGGNALELGQRNGGTNNAIDGGTITAGIDYLVAFGSDGSSYSERINGVEQTLTIRSGVNNGNWFGDTTSTANYNIAVGASVRSSVTQQFNGLIGEMVYYKDDDLSSSEIDLVENYLANKWGITLS